MDFEASIHRREIRAMEHQMIGFVIDPADFSAELPLFRFSLTDTTDIQAVLMVAAGTGRRPHRSTACAFLRITIMGPTRG
jgi:hypothetical protein